MRILKLKKRSGGWRTVCAPSRRELRAYWSVFPELHALQAKMLPSCVHGFVVGRSAVTNALTHLGWEYTASLDLANWFSTVTPWLSPVEVLALDGRLVAQTGVSLFVDGAARQGLPTSPMVANLSAVPMDEDILQFVGPRGVYTRYADDLTVSVANSASAADIVTHLPDIVARHGFAVNPRKTRVQHAVYGRRVVTGVSVGDDDIRPTRAARRKLRAAKHASNQQSADGLREWCSMRLPSGYIKDVSRGAGKWSHFFD